MVFDSHQPKPGDANYEIMMEAAKQAGIAAMRQKAEEAARSIVRPRFTSPPPRLPASPPPPRRRLCPSAP